MSIFKWFLDSTPLLVAGALLGWGIAWIVRSRQLVRLLESRRKDWEEQRKTLNAAAVAHQDAARRLRDELEQERSAVASRESEVRRAQGEIDDLKKILSSADAVIHGQHPIPEAELLAPEPRSVGGDGNSLIERMMARLPQGQGVDPLRNPELEEVRARSAQLEIDNQALQTEAQRLRESMEELTRAQSDTGNRTDHRVSKLAEVSARLRAMEIRFASAEGRNAKLEADNRSLAEALSATRESLLTATASRAQLAAEARARGEQQDSVAQELQTRANALLARLSEVRTLHATSEVARIAAQGQLDGTRLEFDSTRQTLQTEVRDHAALLAERGRELSHASHRIVQLEAELTELAHGKIELGRERDSLAKSLANQQTTNAALSDTLESERAEWRVRLAEHDTALAKAGDTAANLRQQLSASEARAEQLTNNVQALSQRHAELEASLRTRSEELAAANATISDQAAELRRFQTTIDTLTWERDQARTQRDDLSQRHQSLTEDFGVLNEKLARQTEEQTSTLAEARQLLERREQELHELQERLESLHAALAEREGRDARLQQEKLVALQRLDEFTLEARSSHDQRSMEINRLRMDLEHERRAAAETQVRLKTMEEVQGALSAERDRLNDDLISTRRMTADKLAQYRHWLEAKNLEAQEAQNQLQTREAELAELRAADKAEQSNATRMTELLYQRDRELVAAQDHARELQESLDALEENVRELEEHNYRLEQQLQSAKDQAGKVLPFPAAASQRPDNGAELKELKIRVAELEQTLALFAQRNELLQQENRRQAGLLRAVEDELGRFSQLPDDDRDHSRH